MAQREDGRCLYSASHKIPIFEKNGYTEDHHLTVHITDINDEIHIKLRNPTEYAFNYSEKIDLGDFEVIRENQSLDINYKEFKSNLVELFHQFQKKEMFLKCQLKDQKCTLIFYTKSKIKSIIYLTLDLQLTNQHEVITEMVEEMHHVKEANNKLKKQITHANHIIAEKDIEIKSLDESKRALQAYFIDSLKRVENIYNAKIQETQEHFCNKILKFTVRINNLEKKILILKQENNLKTDSSDRLIKTMESLRIENSENTLIIQELKKENCSLNTLRFNLEKTIDDLKKALEDKDILNTELEKKKSELEQDLAKMSVALTQKQSTIDELSKDLVQANGMLVNFNNHYDKKVKEVRELQEDLTVKEKNILEQQARLNQVLTTYDEYRNHFNSDEFEKLKHEKYMANAKIRELEEEMRKLNKINTILTHRINKDTGLLTKN